MAVVSSFSSTSEYRVFGDFKMLFAFLIALEDMDWCGVDCEAIGTNGGGIEDGITGMEISFRFCS